MDTIAAMLAAVNPSAGSELKALWQEYDRAETEGGLDTLGAGRCLSGLCAWGRVCAVGAPVPRLCRWCACAASVPLVRLCCSRVCRAAAAFPLLTAARFVKDLDKFDMALQAAEYEARDRGAGALEEFVASVQGASVAVGTASCWTFHRDVACLTPILASPPRENTLRPHL